MTDNNSRVFDIPLDFLTDGTYTANILKDSPDSESNPKIIINVEKEVVSTDKLKVEMVSGGGYVVHIKKN